LIYEKKQMVKQVIALLEHSGTGSPLNELQFIRLSFLNDSKAFDGVQVTGIC
jgi:hypothetical protein